MREPSRLPPRLARLGAVTLVVLAGQASAPGCLRVERGILVELDVSWLDPAAGPSVWLGDGTALALEAGLVQLESASLLTCDDGGTAHQHASLERLLPLARGLLLPSAQAQTHAHGAASTTLEGPFSIRVEEGTAVLGVFAPPPGSYCAVHLVLDADEGPTVSARGHTDEGAAVLAWSDAPGSAHLTLAEPLVLDRPGATVLHAALFAARPFAGLDTLPASERVLGDLLVLAARHGELAIDAAPVETP